MDLANLPLPVVIPIAITLLLLPPLIALSCYIARQFRHRRPSAVALSAVSRQHFEILQSGRVNEAEVAAAKRRLRALLERGHVSMVEASLRPGTQFLFQVRALAEIGTETAGRILERQLRRRLSDDRLEQSWYWVDLAHGLRTLNRPESLPHLIRCADAALDAPLGHFFAAETICFLGFRGYLQEADAPIGRSALRLLHRTLEGLRYGVSPQVIAEACVGEMIESVWDHRPARPSAPVVRVLMEALKLLRRAPHARAAFGADDAEHEAFEWQLSRLAALEVSFQEYLGEARTALLVQLRSTTGAEQADVLNALNELRVDAAAMLLPLLRTNRFEPLGLAIEVLAWSREPEAGRWLCAYAARHVAMTKRARRRAHAAAPRRPSLPASVPYRSVLRALRGQPAPETERFLMLASRDWDPIYRAAAFGSLGWWEPLLGGEVIDCLKAGRRDPSAEVRQAARAALARLGERASLHWFRQALHGGNNHNVFAAVQVIASEGLTLLWPDLDRLADAENLDLALHVRESLERLTEEMEQARPW